MNVKAFAGDPFRVAEQINEFNGKGYAVVSVDTVSETVATATSNGYNSKVSGNILVVITYEVQD